MRRLDHHLVRVLHFAIADQLHLAVGELLELDELPAHAGNELRVARVAGQTVGRVHQFLELAHRIVVLLRECGLPGQRVTARRAEHGHDVVVHAVHGLEQRRRAFDHLVVLTIGGLENPHRHRQPGDDQKDEGGVRSPQRCANRGIHSWPERAEDARTTPLSPR